MVLSRRTAAARAMTRDPIPDVRGILAPEAVTTAPKLIYRVTPDYPDVAERAGIHGKVTLGAVVLASGEVVVLATLASSNPMFNESAIEAIAQWRYEPARLGEEAVATHVTALVEFALR